MNTRLRPRAQPWERLVEVRNLGHAYSTGEEIVVALRQVEFDLSAGERLVITGPSGSGKTTVLRILAALLRPTLGEVVVAGQDVTAMTGEQRDLYRRRTVGYVWQEPEAGLLPGLTALQNVLAPMLGESGSPEGKLRSAVGILGVMKLDSRLGDRPPQLTAEQTQRLALAVALANAPRLLLADELTVGLEWPTAQALMRDLAAALNRTKTAAIVATDDPRLQAYVDHSVVIREGVMPAPNPAPGDRPRP